MWPPGLALRLHCSPPASAVFSLSHLPPAATPSGLYQRLAVSCKGIVGIVLQDRDRRDNFQGISGVGAGAPLQPGISYALGLGFPLLSVGPESPPAAALPASEPRGQVYCSLPACLLLPLTRVLQPLGLLLLLPDLLLLWPGLLPILLLHCLLLP